MPTIFDKIFSKRQGASTPPHANNNFRGFGNTNNHKSARASPPLRIPVGSKAMMDTCTLMHGNLEGFWQFTAPTLIKNGVEIIISKSCMDELKRLSSRQNQPDTAALAVKAWNSVIEHQKAGHCQIYGDPDDTVHADPVFLYIILKFRHRFPILVITQDNDLAADVNTINHLKSTHCRNEVKAVRLLNDGTLQQRKHHV